MTAHIIHDPSDKERATSVVKELMTYGITAKFFPHIYINEGSEFHRKVKGCCQAHKNIVRYAQVKRKREVLIFESDLIFSSPNAFSYFLSNIPQDYDCYFGGVNTGTVKDGELVRFTGTHCYVVHERFYDTILTADENMHLDHWLWGKGKLILCQPMVCYQPDKLKNIKHELYTW